jgi:hypothetical protein
VKVIAGAGEDWMLIHGAQSVNVLCQPLWQRVLHTAELVHATHLSRQLEAPASRQYFFQGHAAMALGSVKLALLARQRPDQMSDIHRLTPALSLLEPQTPHITV